MGTVWIVAQGLPIYGAVEIFWHEHRGEWRYLVNVVNETPWGAFCGTSDATDAQMAYDVANAKCLESPWPCAYVDAA